MGTRGCAYIGVVVHCIDIICLHRVLGWSYHHNTGTTWPMWLPLCFLICSSVRQSITAYNMSDWFFWCRFIAAVAADWPFVQGPYNTSACPGRPFPISCVVDAHFPEIIVTNGSLVLLPTSSGDVVQTYTPEGYNRVSRLMTLPLDSSCVAQCHARVKTGQGLREVSGPPATLRSLGRVL